MENQNGNYKKCLDIKANTSQVAPVNLHYDKVKRSKIDYCNICGKYAKLTWDHVPPKSCNNHYPINANSWIKGIPQDTHCNQQYQSGIKYRSLCECCNNEILGANYDKALEKFTTSVMQAMYSSLKIPSVIHVSVEVNELCKAVCGHLLAAKNYYDDKCTIDHVLRDYVLDPESCAPNGLHLLFWVYPYSTIAIMRDVAVASIYKGSTFPNGMISVINSFPIAYILSDGDECCGLIDLFSLCHSKNSDIENVTVPVDFNSCFYPNSKRYRHPLWPCNVSDGKDGVMMIGSSKNMNDSRIAQHSKENIQKIKKQDVFGQGYRR